MIILDIESKVPKIIKMKTFLQIIFVACCITNGLNSQAQLQARKIIYNEKEITLPNFLQYNTSKHNKKIINGTIDARQVNISWQTKTETNTSHFELQRSENGKDFEPIETITAGGISNKINWYATNDEKYPKSCYKLYYRLKIVFTNGKEDFSEPVLLINNCMTLTTTVNALP